MYLLGDDDFDEERQVFTKNEWQPKSPFGRFAKKLLKILKKLPKYIFFTLVALVWIVIFATMALRSNDKLAKTAILSDSARELYASAPEDFEVYEIHTKEFMNRDGTIQLINSVYADSAHELEVGLRISGHLGERLYCRIRDDNGHIYGEKFRRTKERNIKLTDRIKYEYVFERISFGDVYIDLSANIINRTESIDISAEFSKFESEIDDYSGYIETSKDEPTKEQEKNRLYFEIFASEDSDTPLFTCVIYDDGTPLELIDFKIADEKYINE